MRQQTSQKGKRHATATAQNRDEDMVFMDLPVTYPVQTSSVAAQRRFFRQNREIRPKRYVVDIPFCECSRQRCRFMPV